MVFFIHIVVTFCSLLIIFWGAVFANEDPPVDKSEKLHKFYAWSMGTQFIMPNLEGEGEGDHSLDLPYAAIAIGGGYFGKNFWTSGSFDIILGPYGPLLKENIKTDFNGSGFSGWLGYAPFSDGLRSRWGGYGLAFGARYMENIGRSVSSGKTTTRDDGSRVTMDDYMLRIRQYSLMPAFFAASLKSARKAGNDPEQLMTRVEGFIFMMGMEIPVQSRYNARLKYIEKDENGKATVRSEKHSGEWTGQTYFISLLALLGV